MPPAAYKGTSLHQPFPCLPHLIREILEDSPKREIYSKTTATETTHTHTHKHVVGGLFAKNVDRQ